MVGLANAATGVAAKVWCMTPVVEPVDALAGHRNLPEADAEAYHTMTRFVVAAVPRRLSRQCREHVAEMSPRPDQTIGLAKS